MTEPNIPLMDDLVLVRNSLSDDWVARRSAEELTSDGLLCWCDGDNSKSKTKIRLAWKHWRPLTRMAIMGIKVKRDAPVRAAPANDTLVEVAAANGEWRNRYSSGRIVDDVLLCWSEGKTSKTAVNKHDTTAWKKWRIPQAEESREDDSKENPEKSSPLVSDDEWKEMFKRNLDEQMGMMRGRSSARDALDGFRYLTALPSIIGFDPAKRTDTTASAIMTKAAASSELSRLWGKVCEEMLRAGKGIYEVRLVEDEGWIDGGTPTVVKVDSRIDVMFPTGAVWYNLPAKDIVVTAGMKYRLAVAGRPHHHSV